MKREDFIDKLKRVMNAEGICLDEPMREHTTFCIGGPADIYTAPRDLKEVQGILTVCDNYDIPCYVMGNGSNLLFPDEGYRGVVLSIGSQMQAATFASDGQVSAQAGILLSKLSALIAEHGFSGFEFAAGIPGTLGGAVTMNAGAYGGEISQILCDAVVYDVGVGGLTVLTREELMFGYRTSLIQNKNLVLLSARFQLKPGEKEKIRERMAELSRKRKEKQPLQYPSAGSTFKRPEGHYAGGLIESAGLKGLRVGGAMVSEKHAGFLVNTGNATAEDMKNLMAEVQTRVWEASGVRLEPEVRIIENRICVWEEE